MICLSATRCWSLVKHQAIFITLLVDSISYWRLHFEKTLISFLSFLPRRGRHCQPLLVLFFRSSAMLNAATRPGGYLYISSSHSRDQFEVHNRTTCNDTRPRDNRSHPQSIDCPLPRLLSYVTQPDRPLCAPTTCSHRR